MDLGACPFGRGEVHVGENGFILEEDAFGYKSKGVFEIVLCCRTLAISALYFDSFTDFCITALLIQTS